MPGACHAGPAEQRRGTPQLQDTLRSSQTTQIADGRSLSVLRRIGMTTFAAGRRGAEITRSHLTNTDVILIPQCGRRISDYFCIGGAPSWPIWSEILRSAQDDNLFRFMRWLGFYAIYEMTWLLVQ